MYNKPKVNKGLNMNNIITKLAIGASVNTVGNGTSSNDENYLIDSIVSIINAIIAILGVVCVIVMIIGGVNYMTSSGDAGKVKKAKDTILYGLIGLIVCVLAFAIVNFVILNVLK